MVDMLWAPWRMDFIAGERDHACFFCRAAQSRGAEAEHLLLFRGATAFIQMNRFPYSNGHLLVAPYRHGISLTDLSAEEGAEILALAGRSAEILRLALRAEGFNVGFNLGKVAGAGVVDHLHLHVVPRWSGDTNFLPVIGETRVMPEYLRATFQRLEPHFHAASA